MNNHTMNDNNNMNDCFFWAIGHNKMRFGEMLMQLVLPACFEFNCQGWKLVRGSFVIPIKCQYHYMC